MRKEVFRSLFPLCVWLLLFQGLAARAEYFEKDPPLKEAAIQLATDYLNSQLTRTYGTSDVKMFYGRGAITIDLLRGYKIEGTGNDTLGAPVVYYAVRTGSENMGFFHRRYTLVLSYSPELRNAGDKYLGLRILETREAKESTTPTLQK